MWNSWNLQAPAWFRNCSRPLKWWLEASLLRQVLEKGVSCKIGIGYWCCQNLTYLADVSDSWCQNTFLRNKLNDSPCNPQKHTSSDVIPPPWLLHKNPPVVLRNPVLPDNTIFSCCFMSIRLKPAKWCCVKGPVGPPSVQHHCLADNREACHSWLDVLVICFFLSRSVNLGSPIFFCL